MREHLVDIREGIKAGRFVNEDAVSQGIVLRILNALGWPIYNTDVVAPQYVLGNTRVDYALCHPPTKPILFIEVKRIGQGNAGDRQLFEYAFHRGVPMAILTDGREWHFFLPGEQGEYSERRVYKLDVVERESDESVNRLTRYLNYKSVRSGEAIEAARRDYRNVAREREIRATLPEAWSKLIEEGDELLLELVADKVESLCGYKPDMDTVSGFLRSSVRLPTSSAPSNTITRDVALVQSTRRVMNPKVTEQSASASFVINDRVYPARNARDVLVKILVYLSDQDPTFLERFAAQAHGRKRRYIARSKEDLYAGRTDLPSVEFRPGWWVGVNLSKPTIARVIGMACRVAGLRLETDVHIHLG